MDLPVSIQVGPFNYRVSNAETDVLRAKADADAPEGHFLGHSDHVHEEIVLNPDQGVGQTRDTLLHEALHAVFNATNLCNQVKSEEKVIAALSPALLDLLRRNPDLVAFLTADH